MHGFQTGMFKDHRSEIDVQNFQCVLWSIELVIGINN